MQRVTVTFWKRPKDKPVLLYTGMDALPPRRWRQQGSPSGPHWAAQSLVASLCMSPLGLEPVPMQFLDLWTIRNAQSLQIAKCFEYIYETDWPFPEERDTGPGLR